MSNQRPPFETFKKPTCRGCYALGSACGRCEKCAWERQQAGFTLDYIRPTSSAPNVEKCRACHRPFNEVDGLHYVIEKAANLLIGGHASEAMKVLMDACKAEGLQP